MNQKLMNTKSRIAISGTAALLVSLTLLGTERQWEAPQTVADGVAVNDGDTLRATGTGHVLFAGGLSQSGGTARLVASEKAAFALGGVLSGSGGTLVFDRGTPGPDIVSTDLKVELGKSTVVAAGRAIERLKEVGETRFFQRSAGTDVNLEEKPGVTGSRVFFFENDGTKATCQVQIEQDGFNKCAFLRFSSNGGNVVCTLLAGWAEKSSLAPVDGTYDFVKEGHSLAFGNPHGYSICGMALSFDAIAMDVKASENSQEAAEWHLTNGVTVAASTGVSLPRTGSVHVWSNSVLRLDAKAIPGQNGGQADIIGHAGSVIHVGASHACGRDVSKGFTLDGATLQFATDPGYCSYLTLRNGACVRALDAGSRGVWLVYKCKDATWKVEGTSPSRIEADFLMTVESWNTNGCLTFDVADVTGDGRSDCDLWGVLKNYKTMPNTPGYFVKKGAGTLALRHPAALADENAHTNAIRLVEGTWLCATNLAMRAAQAIALSGGTLASASCCSNEVGDVSLTADSTISIGEGATFVFADQRAADSRWVDGMTLEITGDFRENAIRFGTSAAALTLRQRRALRYQGRRLRLDENGYVKLPGGLAVVIK